MSKRLGYSVSDLPNVGPVPDNFWGAGGCMAMSIAFWQIVPGLKIAVEWDERDGTCNHAWNYDPSSGRAFDFMGTHNDKEGARPYFSGSYMEWDVSPQDLASRSSVNWNPGEPWGDDTVFEASQVIERHWGLYDPDEDEFYASRTALVYLTLPVSEIEQYQKFNIMDFEHPSQEKLLWDLADSIKTYGLENPLSIAVSHDGQYAMIQDGHHRLGAAKLLGMHELPVVLDQWDEQDYDYLLSIGASPVEGRLRQVVGSRTAASAGKLYRGVRIDLGVDLALAQPGTSIETIGQELQLGPQVLDALSGQGGLGTHWSTRPEIAERFALESSGNGGGTPALVTVDWNGQGEDLERTNTGGTWADEAEVTLLPGTQITVTSVKLGSSFRDGVEVLHSDKYVGYANQFQSAGLPVPQGGPQMRTAAEPGGVLPWTPSHRGYYWITKSDGTLEAVTNDGVNRMFLTEEPWGWEWEVYDSIGLVESGTFGTALRGGDALRDRANDLMSEFDTRAERRTRGPSWGYQDDYTQAPNTLWSKREALYHETGNSSGVAIVLTFPIEYREALALPEGTPADELHITLGYFGSVDEQDPDTEDDLCQACEYTATLFNPFTVSLGGLIRFSGEEQDAFVLNADSAEIDNVRSILLDRLDAMGRTPDKTHGYTPHCTLGYLNPEDSLPMDRWDPIKVPVVAVELWYGEDAYVYPLGGPQVARRKTTSQRYAARLRLEGRR